MRTSWILAALLVIGLAAVPPRVHAKAPVCPGGRYLVSGSSLTGLDGAAEPDVLQVDGKVVAVQSGCPAQKGRVRGTAKGTKVRIRWKSCPGLTGVVILSGTMMEQCRTFAGTFNAKKSGIAKPFLASLSRCGDGVWDADGGEECDGGLGPCGGLCTACTCTSEGATTTTTTVVGQTSTTAPGGTTTTTTPTMPTTSTTTGGGGTTTTTSSPVPTTTSPVPTTTSPVPTTTSTTGAVPTTTSPVPTTTTTIFVIPTTSSSTTTVIPTTTSTMPMFPTTSTTSTTLAGPNLIPNQWMSPGVAPRGANIAIEFGVKNFGNQTATGPWYDYIMMSADFAFGGDQAIGVIQRVASVNAGSQYQALVQVGVPLVPAGTYYLYLHTDGANAVAETNENDNVGGFVQLQVTN